MDTYRAVEIVNGDFGELEPEKDWPMVDPAYQAEAIRQQIEDLESWCGGEVGLVKLDCDEYPCISWFRPSREACTPKAATLGSAAEGPDGPPEILFAIHASKEDVQALDHRINRRMWREPKEGHTIIRLGPFRRGVSGGGGEGEYGL